MITAHLRGGPSDGLAVEVPRHGDVMLPRPYVPALYTRRPVSLHPASFWNRWGRHDGHWIYDWAEAPRVERVYVQSHLPRQVRVDDNPWTVVCLFAEAMMRELEEHGIYDRRDLEWRILQRPDRLSITDPLMRCEVVMEVAS